MWLEAKRFVATRDSGSWAPAGRAEQAEKDFPQGLTPVQLPTGDGTTEAMLIHLAKGNGWGMEFRFNRRSRSDPLSIRCATWSPPIRSRFMN